MWAMPTLLRRWFVYRGRRASGGIHANRPDVFTSAAVADEKDSIIDRPKRREIRVPLGNALPPGAVGIDNPNLLLRQCLFILGLWLEDGGEGQLHAVGAPGGANDGRIGADGHFCVSPRLATHQIECPDAKPSRAALAGALRGDASDIAPRAPHRQSARTKG